MKDKDKTNKQLLDEMAELRRRVAELKKTGSKRMASEFDLRILDHALASSISGIGITDLDGKMIYVNDAAVKMWGYGDKEEVIGRYLSEFWEGERIQETIKVLQKRGGHFGEDIGRRKDGSLFDVEFTASIIIDKSGQPKYMFGSFVDVTERNRTELALRESEEKFRTLAEESPNMIFINKMGRIVYTNRKCVDIMGYNIKEFYTPDFDFMTLIAPESTDLARKSFKIHLKSQDVQPYEYTLITKSGKRIEVIITTKLFQHEKSDAILGIITDITKRKRAEEALKNTHDELERKVRERTHELSQAVEKMRSILDSSPDSITVTDADAVIIDCNQATMNNLGYANREELIGKNALETIAKKDHKRALKNLNIAAEKGSVHNIEYEVVRKDRGTFPANISASAIKDEAGNMTGFVAIAQNITQRKQAEYALKESEAKLKEQKLALEQKNIALREIIAQIEIEKRKIKDDIATNASTILSPILKKLKTDKSTEKYLDLLRHHIEELTSSLSGRLMDIGTKLTAREVEICNMIKGGLSNKDISHLLSISIQTIEGHRKNIRKKLGLKNKGINLTSYLRGL
jgi:PAS domain S-box-containing protein